MNKKDSGIKYGIICPSTKKFYQIPNKNVYKSLVQALELNSNNFENGIKTTTISEEKELSEIELYAEMMDEDI